MFLAAVLVWAILCGLIDLKRRRIPNTLTLGACSAATIHLLWTGHTAIADATPLNALAATAAALTLTLPGYLLNKLGAGDVKMMAAIALLSGLEFTLLTFVVSGVLVAVVLPIWMLLHQLQYMPIVARMAPFLAGLVVHPSQSAIPFGAFLSAGYLASALVLP